MGNHRSRPRTYRYELVWSTTEGFHALVEMWWPDCSPEGCGAFILAKKMAWHRGNLRHWSKFEFGSITLKKLALLHELDELDLAKETRCLVASHKVHEEEVLLKLQEIRKQEEVYWK